MIASMRILLAAALLTACGTTGPWLQVAPPAQTEPADEEPEPAPRPRPSVRTQYVLERVLESRFRNLEPALLKLEENIASCDAEMGRNPESPCAGSLVETRGLLVKVQAALARSRANEAELKAQLRDDLAQEASEAQIEAAADARRTREATERMDERAQAEARARRWQPRPKPVTTVCAPDYLGNIRCVSE
jgi:hypothetical protein